MELINKSALVEKLGEWMRKIELGVATIPLHGRERADAAFEYELLGKVKDFVNTFDTLETKEVDLEKEIENLIEKEKAFITDNREVKYYNGDSFNHIYELEFIAKHFFELGIKAQKGE